MTDYAEKIRQIFIKTGKVAMTEQQRIRAAIRRDYMANMWSGMLR